MPGLFTPISIGSLHLSNRIMRSATAECLAHRQDRILGYGEI